MRPRAIRPPPLPVASPSPFSVRSTAWPRCAASFAWRSILPASGMPASRDHGARSGRRTPSVPLVSSVARSTFRSPSMLPPPALILSLRTARSEWSPSWTSTPSVPSRPLARKSPLIETCGCVGLAILASSRRLSSVAAPEARLLPSRRACSCGRSSGPSAVTCAVSRPAELAPQLLADRLQTGDHGVERRRKLAGRRIETPARGEIGAAAFKGQTIKHQHAIVAASRRSADCQGAASQGISHRRSPRAACRATHRSLR